MFLSHIFEIKKRLLFILGALVLNFIIFYYYSEEILYLIVSPLGVDKYLIFTNNATKKSIMDNSKIADLNKSKIKIIRNGIPLTKKTVMF